MWEQLLEILIGAPDYEWLLIGTSHGKVHPHAAGARAAIRTWAAQKRAQRQNTSGRGCAWYASQNCCYRGSRADCTQAGRLIEGIDADHLIADKGYDTDAILERAAAHGMNAVITPKKTRTVPRPYDEALYKLRHLIENAFLMLKR